MSEHISLEHTAETTSTQSDPKASSRRVSARESMRFQIRGDSINPLIDAATPYIGLAIRIRQSDAPADIEALHFQLRKEIEKLELAILDQYDHTNRMAFRYCLCAFIDEAVMSKDWGADSDWAKQSLLSEFHNETRGGQKFFAIFDRVLSQPKDYADLLELLYLFICLGFEGQFHMMLQGGKALEDQLALARQIIRQRYGELPSRMTEPELQVIQQRQSLRKRLPPWMIITGGIGIAAIIYGAFYWVLSSQVDSMLAPLIDGGQLQ